MMIHLPDSLHPRHSLRAQISLASALIVLSLSTLLSFYAAQSSRTQIEQELGASFARRARNTLELLDRGMFERSREIQNAAVLDEIRDPEISINHKREVLERLQTSFNAYAWIGICDAHGMGLVGTGKYLEGKDLSKHPWCNKGRDKAYIGDVHDALLLSKILPNPSGEAFYLLDVAAPVRDHGGVLRGVLCGHIFWAWATEVLDSERITGQDIFLLSQDGKILSGPEKALADFAALAPQTMQSVQADEKNGYLLEKFSNGKTYLVGYAKSTGYREYTGLGWTTLVREDVATAFAPAQRLQRQIFLTGLALGMLFAWLSWMMAGRIVRPITRLSEAADQVSSGNLLCTIPTKQGDDEVAHLSRAVHDMVISLTREIQHRQTAEDALRLSAKVFESNSEAIMITDCDNHIVSINHAFTEITGYNSAEVMGKNPKVLASGHHDKSFYRELWQSLETHNLWRGEIFNKRKNGDIFPEWITITCVYDAHGKLTHYIAVFFDISERKKEEERVQYLANFDVLSGLPNRYLLADRMDQAILQAQRHHTKVAVLFIDLDHFKNINDSLGHDVGDELLKQVARRLNACLRRSDTLSRLGGDEFIALLPDLAAEDEATYVAEKMLAALAQAFTLSARQLHITPSIGISLYPDDGDNQVQLMRNSDLAMYRAKQCGRNCFAYYEEGMNLKANERLRLENDLRTAIGTQQLLLHYQPKVRVTDKRVVGMEALLRWQHPEFGLISPAVFIPVAEQGGLINVIGDWVLNQAALQARIWQSQGYAIVPLAVNISAVQFRQQGLAERIQTIVRDACIEARFIELEITESTLLELGDESAAMLAKLNAAGFSLALDDFGTGYSSLSRLKLLPMQRLKIDQSFVRDLATDPNDKSIVSATAVLAHALGMTVTAEGVEHQNQLDFITALGCEEYQGYLFSRPVPGEIAVQFLMPAVQ